MKTYHASKRTRHVSRPTFRIIARCLFCGGNRLTFVSGGDDWGNFVTVKCCRAGCEAEGPHVRAMIWEGDEITDAMKQESADGWSAVWDYVDGKRPRIVVVDGDCKEIERPARRRRARRPAPAMVLTPARPAADHRVAMVAPPKAISGHNGHHQNGSV